MAEEIFGVELKGEIQVQPIDIRPYIGKKAKIATVKIFNKNFQNKTSYFLQITTESLGKIEGTDKDMTASKNFGLLFDTENGGIGWGDKSKLTGFLKSKEVKTVNDLIGVEVLIQAKDPDPDTGIQFLTFF